MTADLRSELGPAPGLRAYSATELSALGCEGPRDWEDLAKRWEAQGQMAFAHAAGVVVYAGRWEGNVDGTWAARGAAEAEARVHRWIGQLAQHYPEALRDAAALVASSTTPAMVRAALGARLRDWAQGYTDAGGDGAAARARAEAEIWEAFRRRLMTIAGSII